MLFRHLGDRGRDVLDWIDYRPESNFWPLFALPPMLSVAWAYGGVIGLGVLLGSAVLLSAIVFCFTALGVLFWVMVRSATDAISTLRVPTKRISAPTRSMPNYGRYAVSHESVPLSPPGARGRG